jgi:aquaporin Z
MKDWQKYLAEVFGTFTLVFVGSLALVGVFKAPDQGSSATNVIVAFAFGLALLAGLYAFAEVSGGHFNPAVSLAMFLDRRLAAADLVSYWASQIIGAVLASLLVLLAFTKQDVANTATVHSSTKVALIVEIAMTAVFVLVILQVTKSGTYGATALAAIPLTLVAIHFAAIPFSGASVNPARSFGPALVGHQWTGFWVYVVGPAAGAVIGWLVHKVVVAGDMGFGGRGAEVAAEAPGSTEDAGQA